MMTTQDRAIWRTFTAGNSTDKQIDAATCAYSARVTDIQLQHASNFFMACCAAERISVRSQVKAIIRHALDNGYAHHGHIAI